MNKATPWSGLTVKTNVNPTAFNHLKQLRHIAAFQIGFLYYQWFHDLWFCLVGLQIFSTVGFLFVFQCFINLFYSDYWFCTSAYDYFLFILNFHPCCANLLGVHHTYNLFPLTVDTFFFDWFLRYSPPNRLIILSAGVPLMPHRSCDRLDVSSGLFSMPWLWLLFPWWHCKSPIVRLRPFHQGWYAATNIPPCFAFQPSPNSHLWLPPCRLSRQ